MSLLENKVLVVAVGAVAAVVIAFLAFGVFGIQTLFTNTEVAEGGPVFASEGDAEGEAEGEAEDGEEFEDALDEAAENPTEAQETVEEVEMEDEIVTLVEGDFAGLSRYDVSGDAMVLNDGSEQRFLRLEGFESTNGPDLNVYLRAEDGEFIDLGDLKGNIGDQNYEIPADVDLDRFNTVQIWCVRFDVNFGEAVLA